MRVTIAGLTLALLSGCGGNDYPPLYDTATCDGGVCLFPDPGGHCGAGCPAESRCLIEYEAIRLPDGAAAGIEILKYYCGQ